MRKILAIPHSLARRRLRDCGHSFQLQNVIDLFGARGWSIDQLERGQLMHRFLMLFLVVALAACEGPVGPAGPQGATGPQGPPGLQGAPASIRWGVATILSDGSATLTFANAQARTSVVTCYVSNNPSGPWIIFATSYEDAPACVAFDVGSSLTVGVINSIPGWFFLATVAEGG